MSALSIFAYEHATAEVATVARVLITARYSLRASRLLLRHEMCWRPAAECKMHASCGSSGSASKPAGVVGQLAALLIDEPMLQLP